MIMELSIFNDLFNLIICQAEQDILRLQISMDNFAYSV